MRGGPSAASMLADRWLRTPFAWVRATKQSSSTRRPRPAQVELGVHGHGAAEQDHRLVDEVAPQVGQQPAGVGGVGQLAPALGVDLRTPALEARLQTRRRAEGALVEQAAQGQEVAVPAPVVEHRQHHAGRPRLVGQGAALGRGRRQRLVDHHRQPAAIAARASGTWARLGAATTTRSSSPGAAQSSSADATTRAPGCSPARRLGAPGVGGDDRGHAHPGGRRDQRGVEPPPGQAVADDRDAQLLTAHGPIIAAPRSRRPAALCCFLPYLAECRRCRSSSPPRPAPSAPSAGPRSSPRCARTGRCGPPTSPPSLACLDRHGAARPRRAGAGGRAAPRPRRRAAAGAGAGRLLGPPRPRRAPEGGDRPRGGGPGPGRRPDPARRRHDDPPGRAPPRPGAAGHRRHEQPADRGGAGRAPAAAGVRGGGRARPRHARDRRRLGRRRHPRAARRHLLPRRLRPPPRARHHDHRPARSVTSSGR